VSLLDDFALTPMYWTRLLCDFAIPRWFISAGVAILDYLIPGTAINVAAATMGLVILDTLTGVVRTRVLGHQVTSAKFGRCITKGFAYAVAVCTVGLGAHAIPQALPFQGVAVTLMLTAAATREMISIFENLHAMGYTLPAPVMRMFEAAIHGSEAEAAKRLDDGGKSMPGLSQGPNVKDADE
jgi:phage-related holin